MKPPEVRLDPGATAIPEGHRLERWTLWAGAVGLAALAASFGLGLGDGRQLFHSYLVAWLFGLSLALGGLFFVLLQLVTRAGWSVAVRRLAEHTAGTLGLFLVLFVPLALSLGELYPWAGPEAGVEVHGQHLRPDLFLARSLAYLASWALIAGWVRRRSLAQDESRDPAVTRRLQSLAAPALVWFGFTLTFAAFDWVLSLDPHWHSTIFGVYFFSGTAMVGLAVLVLLVLGLGRAGLLAGVVTAEHRHDLGKLLFAFLVFWAYIAFSQYMLIWYANLPEETAWYAHRLAPGWKGVSVGLAVGHFVLPFFFLLPREAKRRPATLGAAAAWLLAMHYLDLYWLVMPGLHRQGVQPHLLDLLTLVAVLGLFLAAWGLLARRRPLVPVGDPRLAESLSFENV